MSARCVWIDWLTMYCKSGMMQQNKRWEWKLQKEGTAQFAEMWKVYDRERGDLYCVVQRRPYSPIIPKDAVMVKVENRYLYYQNWNVELCNFLLASNITPISISRIDIACDFNRFANNLHPRQFIANFCTKKYRYAGRSKWNINGSGSTIDGADYLRIGSRDSEISAYLYNKSVELREVQDKPYIRDMWERSGLDTSRDVWRLEVSLSNVQLRWVNTQNGEIFRIDLDQVSTQGRLENIYNCAIEKAFDFRHNEEGKRTTRLKRVQLFSSTPTTLIALYPNDEPKTSRIDKIIVKRLANYYSKYRVESQEDADKLIGAIEVLIKNEELRRHLYEKVIPTLGYWKER